MFTLLLLFWAIRARFCNHFFLNRTVQESRVRLFNGNIPKFNVKLYNIGYNLGILQINLEVSRKKIECTTQAAFVMPKSGMYSSFKTNSVHCQNPHCFLCWFILWLGQGYREERENREREREKRERRELESKRGTD